MRKGPLRFAPHVPPAVVALYLWIFVDAVCHVVNLPARTLVYISSHYPNTTIALGKGAD